MKLSALNIVKLLQVKGVGRGKVFKFDNLIAQNPASNNDLADLLIEQIGALKLQPLSLSEILRAFNTGEDLYEKSKDRGIKMVPHGDALYPPLLNSIAAPPVLLHVSGNINGLLEKEGVAVIGTRQPTNFGRLIGERIGYRLGERGINVISGLAIGCDTAGHTGCLQAKGMTTAILAHGLDKVYPKENTKLAEQIVENNGCLITEYILKTNSLPNYFVERDRIQAGLSKATFVVETDIKGGTMHAVNATIENKRILAVYNHPLDKQTDKSRGNQLLINQRRAIGVQSKEDIERFIQLILPDSFGDISVSKILEETEEQRFADERTNDDTNLPDLIVPNVESDPEVEIDVTSSIENLSVPSITTDNRKNLSKSDISETQVLQIPVMTEANFEFSKIPNSHVEDVALEPFVLTPPKPKKAKKPNSSRAKDTAPTQKEAIKKAKSKTV